MKTAILSGGAKLALANLIVEHPSVTPRIVILGDSGVGKTTYASKFPNPVFLDVEFGTGALDVPTIPIREMKDLRVAVDALVSEKHDFKTVIIDSIDWLEEIIVREVCSTRNAKSLGDFDYGKGYAMLSDDWKRVLVTLDRLRARGLIVVLIAHARAETVKRPDIAEYERMSVALRRVDDRGRVIEWADVIVYILRQKGGKREFAVEPKPGFAAKTRYTIPLDAVEDPAKLLAAMGWRAPEAKKDSKIEQETIVVN